MMKNSTWQLSNVPDLASEAGKNLLGRRKNPAADYPKAENKTQSGMDRKNSRFS